MPDTDTYRPIAAGGTPNSADALVQAAAAALLSVHDEVAAQLAAFLIDRAPELTAAGVEDLVHASCRSNVIVMLDQIARAVPKDAIGPSVELIGYTRQMVRRGLSLDAIMGGYRAGSAYIVEKWIGQLAKLSRSSPESIEAVRRGSTFVWCWLDVVSESLAAEYRAEVARQTQERSQVRLEEIRNALSGADFDEESATRRFGYWLAGRHLGVVLYDRTDGSERGHALDRELRTLSSTFDSPSRLAVHAGSRAMWCWFQWPAGQPIPLPAMLDDTVVCGIGAPAEGIEGFRRTHREALDALRVARMSPQRTGAARYQDVEITALCTADPTRARQFVSSVLGPLAADDPAGLRQRDTLMTFYACDSNFRATAARLGLHHNTVRYRLEQIERKIGRGVQERTLALDLALQLAQSIGLQPTGREDL